ncbi:MAG TPA: hypothetical protein VLA76_09140, partial [Candidatus Angelobacter sp.]|nr:hypothetical protein [Candidatus Angelobacter sp.]
MDRARDHRNGRFVGLPRPGARCIGRIVTGWTARGPAARSIGATPMAERRDPIADLKRIGFLLEAAQEPSYR